MTEMLLQPGLEQACFRCGGWHVLVTSGQADEHPASSCYLYVDCPGRGAYIAGRYFAGQAGTTNPDPVRERAR